MYYVTKQRRSRTCAITFTHRARAKGEEGVEERGRRREAAHGSGPNDFGSQKFLQDSHHLVSPLLCLSSEYSTPY